MVDTIAEKIRENRSDVPPKEQLEKEIIDICSEYQDPVKLQTIIDESSADSLPIAKQALSALIDQGVIKTTPGFKYQKQSDNK